MTYGVIKEIHINVEDNDVLNGLEVSSCQTYLEPKKKVSESCCYGNSLNHTGQGDQGVDDVEQVLSAPDKWLASRIDALEQGLGYCIAMKKISN